MESRLKTSPTYKAQQVAPSPLDASKEWKRVGSTGLGQCDTALESGEPG